ncbi:MAG TPA: cytochrome P450 [Nannocystis sp.]|jgi:cytochrome P450/phytoene/squalene synthetase
MLSTLQMVREPFTAYRRWFAEYGDPVAVPTLHGRVVLTADPEGVKAIFTADADDIDPFLPDVFRPFLGVSSVLLSSGTQHRRQRKLLGPTFHSGRLAAQVPRMVAVCEAVVSRLQPGARVSLRALMQDVTLRVIAEAILCAGEPARADGIARAAYDLIADFHPILLFAPALHRELGGLGPFARFNRAARVFDEQLLGEIGRRRAAPGDDILGAMLTARDDQGAGLDDLSIAHQMRTLLFAGYETTGLTLAWALYWLGVHPELRARVLAEVEAVGDPVAATESCPLLAAFCDEVLRVSPILPEVRRTLRAPLLLRGYELPAGTHVSANMAMAHMRPETFSEPERFLPERFMNRRYSPFEFFPWGRRGSPLPRGRLRHARAAGRAGDRAAAISPALVAARSGPDRPPLGHHVAALRSAGRIRGAPLMPGLRLWLGREQRAFLAAAMQQVSRSFALMTPCLEAPLDSVVATAYLVCRLADCVEDCEAPLAWKRERFAELRAVLATPSAADRLLAAWVDADWRDLAAAEAGLARLGGSSALWSIYAAFPGPVRAAFERWIGVMIEGMARTLDPEVSPRWVERGAVHALATADDYDRYCDYVAGTVGQLLTDLATLHYELEPEVVAVLRRHADAAGRGLQKTNILKDYARDLERGVCYLPADWTDTVADAPLGLRGASAAFTEFVVGDVLVDLDALAVYLHAVPASAVGLRLGLLVCLLPAQATMQRATQRPAALFTPEHDIKISRDTFKRCLLDARHLAGDAAAAVSTIAAGRAAITAALASGSHVP